jgi:hypothetical protein
MCELHRILVQSYVASCSTIARFYWCNCYHLHNISWTNFTLVFLLLPYEMSQNLLQRFFIAWMNRICQTFEFKRMIPLDVKNKSCSSCIITKPSKAILHKSHVIACPSQPPPRCESRPHSTWIQLAFQSISSSTVSALISFNELQSLCFINIKADHRALPQV